MPRKKKPRRIDSRRSGKKTGQSVTSKDPPKLIIHYPTPEELEEAGPLVPGECSIAGALRRSLQREEKPIPPSVIGHFLVDTGARRTSISQQTAKRLGLNPVSYTHIYGAHGRNKLPTFHVCITLTFDHEGGKYGVSSTTQAIGIPKLEEQYRQFGLHVNGVPTTVIGLLGREFFRHCLIFYGGNEGKVEIWLDKKSFGKPIG